MAYEEMVTGFVADVEENAVTTVASVEDMYAPVTEEGMLSAKAAAVMSSVKLEKVGDKVRMFFPVIGADGSPLVVSGTTIFCATQKKNIRAPADKALQARMVKAFDTKDSKYPCKIRRRHHVVVAVYEGLGRKGELTDATQIVLKTLSFGDSMLRKFQDVFLMFNVRENDVQLSAPDDKAVQFMDYSVQGAPKKYYDEIPEGYLSLVERQELEESALEMHDRLRTVSFLGITPTHVELMRWIEEAEMEQGIPSAPPAAAPKVFGNKPAQPSALGQPRPNAVAAQSTATGEFNEYVEDK